VPSGGESSFFVQVEADGTQITDNPTEIQWYVTAAAGSGQALRMPFYFRAIAAGPLPSAVVSRKMHGGFEGNIPLPLTGNPGIECRTGGDNGVHQVVFTFPASVTVGGAEVTSGEGRVTGVSGRGTPQITVNLNSVNNAQTIVLSLLNVNNQGNVSVPIAFLLGDVNGDRFVLSGDYSQVRKNSGNAANQSNFRLDVINDGTILSGDFSEVRKQSGTQLP
jgi:hypothetical protein